MVQRLVRIGSARNRFHQYRQDGGQLMTLMRLAGHGLEIAVGLPDIRNPVGGKDPAYILRIALGGQQKRCRIGPPKGRFQWNLCRLGRLSRSARLVICLFCPQALLGKTVIA